VGDDPVSIHGFLICAGGLALLWSTLALVRRRLLSIRYGLGWIAVALLAVVGGPLLPVISNRVDALGFTPTGFSLGVLAAFLGLICLQLSISLSGVQRVLRDLTEHAALVEHRVRELERRDAREQEPVR
jgi:Na+/melibiose symporter-like transporter